MTSIARLAKECESSEEKYQSEYDLKITESILSEPVL
jgi:hypothetical protein